MTIHLPDDLERSIEDAVRDGRFASVDEAMAEAANLLLREQGRTSIPSTVGAATPDPLIGSMRDAADEMDKIVADAIAKRRAGAWREISVE